jgi:hypothetical protein
MRTHTNNNSNNNSSNSSSASAYGSSCDRLYLSAKQLCAAVGFWAEKHLQCLRSPLST